MPTRIKIGPHTHSHTHAPSWRSHFKTDKKACIQVLLPHITFGKCKNPALAHYDKHKRIFRTIAKTWFHKMLMNFSDDRFMLGT